MSEANLAKLVTNYVDGYHTQTDTNLFKRVYIGLGTVNIPRTATSKRTGTVDSHLGEIADDGFVITYDVGMMAGGVSYILKTNPRPDMFHWYYETVIDGYKVYMALVKPFEKTRLHITVWTKDKNAKSDLDLGTPANFVATVSNKAEVEKLLAVAFSFKAK